MEKEASLYQKMRKGVKAAAFVGLTALGLSECTAQHATSYLDGNFRGYKTSISTQLDSPHVKSLVIRSNEPLELRHVITAYDTSGSGKFEQIFADGVNINGNNLNTEFFSKISPLGKYLNSDSLGLAYHAVLVQNGRGSQ